MIRSQIALMERNGASADADLVLDAQAALLQAVSPEELARRHRDPAALAGRIRETLLGAMREDIQCLKSQIDTVDAQLEALRSELVLGGEVGMSGAGVATAFHVDPYEKRRAAVYRTASVAMFCLTVLLFAFATMETLTLFGIRLFGFAGGAAMGILLSIIADATLGRLLPKSKASRGRAIRALAATGLVCFVISGGVFLALRSGLESGEPWLLPAALTCFEATLLFVAAVLGNAHRLYTYAERLARNFAELQRYRFELRENLREALHESKNAIPSSATRGEYSLAVSSGVFAPWFGHARLVLSAAAVTIFVAAIVLGHAGFRSQPSPSSGDSRTSARAPVRFVVVLDVSRSFSQQQDFRVMANRLASVLRASAPFIGGVGVRGSGLTDVPAEFFWGPPPSPPSPPSVSERLLLFSANQAALQAAIRGEQQKRTEEYNRRIEEQISRFADSLVAQPVAHRSRGEALPFIIRDLRERSRENIVLVMTDGMETCSAVARMVGTKRPESGPLLILSLRNRAGTPWHGGSMPCADGSPAADSVTVIHPNEMALVQQVLSGAPIPRQTQEDLVAAADRNASNSANVEADLHQLIAHLQRQYVRPSFGPQAGELFTEADLEQLMSAGSLSNITRTLRNNPEFLRIVAAVRRMPGGRRGSLMTACRVPLHRSWREPGAINADGQTEAGVTAERVIADAVVDALEDLTSARTFAAKPSDVRDHRKVPRH